ncbi:MAG TPA: glycosyltransferase family 87 protein [Blastocatellia bacterium]|nr:glycosyltransferase family 87 protein [Blastocatellia bacterium]
MTSKQRRSVILLVGLILLALLSLAFTRGLVDFPIYHISGRSLMQGRLNIYAPEFSGGPGMTYRYPPFFLIAFLPMSLLPYPVAAHVWYWLSVLMIGGIVRVVRGLLGSLKSRRPVWLVVFFAVAQYYVMQLRYGNAHLLIVFLMFASLYFAMRKKDWIAGLLMAFSISIKVTPILVLPYFAIKKRWNYLLAIALFLIPINLMPAGYFGFAKNSELLRTWFAHVLLDKDFHEVNGPINLSLKGQLRRYFTDIDYTQRVLGDTRYPSINIASLTTGQTDAIWAAVSAGAMFGTLLFLWWISNDKNRAGSNGPGVEKAGGAGGLPLDEPLQLGLMISLMLFIGPLSSKIYFTALLWPVAFLAMRVFAGEIRMPEFCRNALFAICVANVVLPLLPGRSLQRLFLVLGVDFYLNGLLLIALVLALISSRRALRSSIGAPQTQALSATRTS